MEKFNSALSTIFYIIWIPLGILLAIVLFLFLSSMSKTQMTGVLQGNFVQGTGGQQGQLQQPSGQQVPQVSGVPQQSPDQGGPASQQGGQQNPIQPPLQK